MAMADKEKPLKFKYKCKFCNTDGLAWKMLGYKWTLFDDSETAHVCQSTKKKKQSVNMNVAKKIIKKVIDEEKKSDSEVLEGIVDEVNKNPILAVDYGKAEKQVVMFYKDADLKKLKKVKLINAEAIYQPVNGSDSASIYYCVAIYDGLKFGARIKKTGTTYNVSVRVEGSDYEKWATTVAFQKIAQHDGYGSVHVQVDTLLNAKMIIGGLIILPDIQALTPVPNLDKLVKFK